MENYGVPTRFRLNEILDGIDPPISQRELARRSGVSPTTINAMYNNTTSQVSLGTLDAVSQVLNVEPGDLIQRDEAKRRRK